MNNYEDQLPDLRQKVSDAMRANAVASERMDDARGEAITALAAYNAATAAAATAAENAFLDEADWIAAYRALTAAAATLTQLETATAEATAAATAASKVFEATAEITETTAAYAATLADDPPDGTDAYRAWMLARDAAADYGRAAAYATDEVAAYAGQAAHAYYTRLAKTRRDAYLSRVFPQGKDQ